MKPFISNLIIMSALLLLSCKKEPAIQKPWPVQEPVVEMLYISLNEMEVKYMHQAVVLDLNKDNRADILFDVSRIGDFINKVDKFRFIIHTSIYTGVPVNNNEQIPVLKKGALIPLADFAGNEWYIASEITLFEKVLFENGAVQWYGNWLTAQKAFIPFQMLINSQKHNGWVEVTADPAKERLILHRAAYSKEANQDIKAGL